MTLLEVMYDRNSFLDKQFARSQRENVKEEGGGYDQEFMVFDDI